MTLSKETFKIEYTKSIVEIFAKPLKDCTKREKYESLVRLVGNLASSVRTDTVRRAESGGAKQVFYFSMEFLVGRLLENYLINLGIHEIVADGLEDLGENLGELLEPEPDPGLGNGGLGRLAACFMDSMARLGIYGTGMGIRYRFGLFRQLIRNGYQEEEPDAWLEDGYPWERQNPDDAVVVRFGGYIDRQFKNGKLHFEHRDYKSVAAIPYDVPVVGYGGNTVNLLRLWSAKPLHESIDLDAFNRGDYSQAMRERCEIDALTAILYPDDSMGAGRALRLRQEYFFVAAGIASIVRDYRGQWGAQAWREFPERVAIHINDTHPTLCIPELLRVLIDEEGLEWDEAWDITTRTVSFTNHTILPEALEKWPVELLRSLLPRVYMIIEEIDRRWREKLARDPAANYDLLPATAILWDGAARMANLSVIGSHSVNGVAALHTEILKKTVFGEFFTLSPEKFSNKTNGVSHRRFLLQSNPGLAALINSAIGEDWVREPSRLTALLPSGGDPAFRERLYRVKRENKVRLAEYIRSRTGILIDPDSVFDVQVKRIHAYKRQLLNAFKVLYLYNRQKAEPGYLTRPYTFIFSGKAAQGYAYAKEIIKFISSVADTVNSDPDVSKIMRAVFIENFCVSNAQLIYPAADISEQISTAGKEASGTGNMKFMMNGAVTLGTADGANIEIRAEVGCENIMIFGLSSDEVMNYYTKGGYDPVKIRDGDPHLELITSQLVNGFFKKSGTDFWGIYDALLQNGDEYFVLKDFADYLRAWHETDALYGDAERWGRVSTANIAASGFFSSDRTIGEYARDIWGIGR